MTKHFAFARDALRGSLFAIPLMLTLVLAPSASATSAAPHAPTVLYLSPKNGGLTGGQRITIRGSNFVGVESVQFGNVPGTHLRVTSLTELQIVDPSHSAGEVAVTVRSRYGLSNGYDFSYVAPLVLDGAAPSVSVHPLPTPFVPSSWSGPNPPTNCAASSYLTGISGLDFCGATLEGLAPLQLPSNWSSLSDPRKGFVLMNLERIERGETPIVGISSTLDNYAATGALANTDPEVSYITDGVGGGIWDGGDFVTWGVLGFLYFDGPGTGGLNEDCTSAIAWGCWGHRDNILDASTNPNLAVGVADGPDGDSAAVISDQFSDFNFTWASELANGYPEGLPSDFTLTKPSLTEVTTTGNGTIKLIGTGLDTVTTIYFSNITDKSSMTCSDSDHCTLDAPSRLAPNTIYNVSVLNSAGLSADSSADRYTTGT